MRASGGGARRACRDPFPCAGGRPISGVVEPRALTAVVADDEELARRRIVDLLRGERGVRVVGECATGSATLDAIRLLDPDVLFLDVQMPGLTGFEVLARLRPDERPVVVFSTAYDEYAIDAFDVHAVDYLLKPFDDARFDEALRRAERAIRSQRVLELHERVRGLLEEVGGPSATNGITADEDGYLRRFAVRAGERIAVVDAGAVDWIEAAGDYVELHVGSRTHLVRGTMTSLERRLDPARFLRIHRSVIVQLDRIRHLQADERGEYVAVLADGRRLRVSRGYRARVLDRLGMRW